MHDSWTCLSVSKGPGIIPEHVELALRRGACQLHRDKINKLLFQTNEVSGLIETQWETHTLVTRSGVLFKAEIESEDGTWQVNFLLHTRDLERGARHLESLTNLDDEMGVVIPMRFPIDELYQFKDLSPRKLN